MNRLAIIFVLALFPATAGCVLEGEVDLAEEDIGTIEQEVTVSCTFEGIFGDTTCSGICADTLTHDDCSYKYTGRDCHSKFGYEAIVCNYKKTGGPEGNDCPATYGYGVLCE